MRLVEKARWIVQQHVDRGGKIMSADERIQVEGIIAEVDRLKALKDGIKLLEGFGAEIEYEPKPTWEDEMEAMQAYEKACDQFDKGYTQ